MYHPCPELCNPERIVRPSNRLLLGTWYRFQVKFVRMVPEPNGNWPELARDNEIYSWYEMGVFVHWSSTGSCRIICVDTPEYLQTQLLVSLRRKSALDFKNPFAMQQFLVDQILVLYDISVWRVRDPVRQIEKVRSVSDESYGCQSDAKPCIDEDKHRKEV